MTVSDLRRITISPTTRIEGHGKVVIVLDEFGNVSEAYFQATEIRGFEQFLRGMDTERLPFIISRICGVCSTAHVMASVKAIEDAYKIEVTETARKLRELLLLGQIIVNHSLVFFFLTLPDFWFDPKEEPSKRNIFEIMRHAPEVVRRAIELRTFGVRLLAQIGKREVHIVSVIPGGLLRPLTEEERINLLKGAKQAITFSKEALTLCKDLFDKHWAEYKEMASIKTNYMGLVEEGGLSFYSGDLHVIDPLGETLARFPPSRTMEHLEEKALGWTYAKFAYLKRLGWPEGILKVSSTARMNVIQDISTPLAKDEFLEFRGRFGRPAHETLLFDYSRLIEMLHACERAKELLEDEEITSRDVRVAVKPRDGDGIGVVEAPRGTLVHTYSLTKEGRVQNLRLIIPTQINNAAINIDVKKVASGLISYGQVKPGLLNTVEMIIRFYDPCIKCATRSSRMGYISGIEIRDIEGRVVKELP